MNLQSCFEAEWLTGPVWAMCLRRGSSLIIGDVVKICCAPGEESKLQVEVTTSGEPP